MARKNPVWMGVLRKSVVMLVFIIMNEGRFGPFERNGRCGMPAKAGNQTIPNKDERPSGYPAPASRQSFLPARQEAGVSPFTVARKETCRRGAM